MRRGRARRRIRICSSWPARSWRSWSTLADAGAAALPRYRWVVLATGAGGAAAFAMFRQGLPSIAPYIRETFGLSLSQLGLLLAALAVGALISVVPWGVAADRFGERSVLSLGLAGAAAALALAAAGGGALVFALALFLAGLAGSATTGASGRAVMTWFPRGERGLALGLRQMALPAGAAVGGLVLPRVASQHGLGRAMTVLAVVVAIAGVAAAALLREPPRGSGPRPDPPGFGALIRDPGLRRLSIVAGLLVVGQAAMLGFTAVFLHDRRGMSATSAATVFAACMAAGAIVRVLLGRVSDRRGERIAVLRAVVVADAACLLALAVTVAAPWWLLGPVLVSGFVAAMSWNGLAFTAAAEIAGNDSSATAVSLQNVVIVGGTMLATPAFAALAEHAGWTLAYAATAIGPMLAFLLLRPAQ